MFFALIENYLKLKGDIKQLLDFAATSVHKLNLENKPIEQIHDELASHELFKVHMTGSPRQIH